MIRRTLYFWLEQLKINPAERKAVSLLLVLLIALATTNGVLRQSSPFDETYYADLEQVFEQRAALLEQEEEKILARYHPEASRTQTVTITPDTLTDDSLETKEILKDSAEPASDQVNVNKADAELLETLPGIGPVYARRIIEYRTKNGSFSTLEELMEIKGIGKKRLEKLKPFIKLKGVN